MTPRSRGTATGLTYTEMLATIPWVAMLPLGQSRECQHWAHRHRGRAKACKVPAKLLYFDLDGTMHAFCHFHMYEARMSRDHILPDEDLYAEVERNRAWEKRCRIERGAK